MQETEAPEASILEPTTNTVYYSDRLIVFSAVLFDSEDDPQDLVAYWSSNRDGILEDVTVVPDSSGEIIGYGQLSEGQHAIELHVEDTTGRQMSTVSLSMSAPQYPTHL